MFVVILDVAVSTQLKTAVFVDIQHVSLDTQMIVIVKFVTV